MGYTTQKSNVLIGLGASSISSSGSSFVQNYHDIKKYREHINVEKVAIFNGHTQTDLDLKTSEAVQEVMCLGKTEIENVINILPPNISELVEFKLKTLQDDKLINIKNGELSVSQVGWPFLRNVCMAFDYRFINKSLEKKTFSQTI